MLAPVGVSKGYENVGTASNSGDDNIMGRRSEVGVESNSQYTGLLLTHF